MRIVALNNIISSCNKIGLEWIALAFVLIFGSAMAFLTPVYQIPDEPNHFARAYQVSELTFICPIATDEDGIQWQVSSIPSVFFDEKYTHDLVKKKYSWRDIGDFLSTSINPDIRTEIRTNAGPYAPLLYMPQAIMGFLARSLGCTAGAVFYAMRLGAVLFVAACVFLSIRFLPEKGLLIFLLAMTPMVLCESASNSADAMLYGCCFLFSAYLLFLSKNEKHLTVLEMTLLLLMAAAMGLLKQVYGTILLLYFLIPWQRMGSKKRYFIFGTSLLVVCLGVSFSWLHISGALSQVTLTTPMIRGGVNMHEQIQFILYNPWRFFKVLVNTFRWYSEFYVMSFIGILGWLTILLPRWYYVAYTVAIVLASVAGGEFSLKLWQRILILSGFIASGLALTTLMYVAWTEPGYAVVEGIQGRYFIPLALMTLTAFSYGRRIKHEKTFACIAGLVSAFITLLKTIQHFYM